MRPHRAPVRTDELFLDPEVLAVSANQLLVLLPDLIGVRRVHEVLHLPPPKLCRWISKDKGGNVRDARRICARCEVLDECGEYALERPELDGVWGGLSTRQRRTVRRARESQGEAPLTAAGARGEEAAA